MSTQQATTQQPLLQAIDLKKYYPVKKGLFAPERLVKALDGVSFNLERGKTIIRGRICSSTTRRRRSCVARKSRLCSRTRTVR